MEHVLASVMERSKLIYDVGMNNGNDTAFYLSRGFRVVAIEADPTLVAAAATRFRDALEQRHLILLNVAISDSPGEATFWICDGNSEWNSFSPSLAARNGSPHHPIIVPTRTFESIIEEHGDPYYVKIDIEGHDVHCLRDLGRSQSRLPQFLSWESDPAPDRGLSSEVSPLLQLAHDIGFNRFKLIDQATYLPLPSQWSVVKVSDSVVWRLLHAANQPSLHGARPLLRHLTHRAKLGRRFEWDFDMGASGPWGDEMPGSWMTFEAAVEAHRRATREHFAGKHRPDHSFWCDWHATS